MSVRRKYVNNLPISDRSGGNLLTMYYFIVPLLDFIIEKNFCPKIGF